MYKITIEKVTKVNRVMYVYLDPQTNKRYNSRQDIKEEGSIMESIWDRCQQIPVPSGKMEDELETILEQKTDDLDIGAVVKVINKI